MNLLCAVLLPEVSVLFLVDLLDHVEGLTDELLLDDLEELVLLESLTRHVKWEIIRVHNSTDKGKVLGHHVFKVVGDEDTSDVKLDLVNLLPIVGEHVIGSSLGDEEDGLKGDFSLSGEVSSGHGIILVLGETLVELIVFLIFNLAGSVNHRIEILVKHYRVDCTFHICIQN